MIKNKTFMLIIIIMNIINTKLSIIIYNYIEKPGIII